MQGFVASVVNAQARASSSRRTRKEADRIVRKAVVAPRRPAPRPARRATPRRKSRAGRHGPAGQARRLHGQGPRDRRDLHRRGRLRRRLGQAGPRPLDAGGAPAARQDPQRREGAHRQGAAEHGDPGADHRARHRRARRVRHREAALPQDHPDDGRRRRRRAHPHADPHAAVPRDAGAGRGRLHLHRQAAAVQGHAGQAGALHREGVRARGRSCSATSSSASRSPTTTATPFKLTDVRWQRYSRLLKQYEGWSARCAPSTATRSCSSSRSRRSSTTQIKTAEELLELLERDGRRRPSRTSPSWSPPTRTLIRVKATERRSNLARTHRLRRSMFDGQRVPPARARARRAGPARRHAAVHGRARRRDRGGAVLRGAAPRGAGRRRPRA